MHDDLTPGPLDTEESAGPAAVVHEVPTTERGSALTAQVQPEPVDAAAPPRWLTEFDSLAGLPTLRRIPGLPRYTTPLHGELPHATLRTYMNDVPRPRAHRHPATFIAAPTWQPRQLPMPSATALQPAPVAPWRPDIPPLQEDLTRFVGKDRSLWIALGVCVALLLAASLLVAAGVLAPQLTTPPATVSTPAPTIVPTLAPTPAPTLTPTPIPTATTVPTVAPTAAPKSAPPPAAPTATPRPQAPSGIAPTVTSLTLGCTSPGASLPLHNSSGSAQAYTIAVPQGVLVNGWSGQVSGTVNAGQTLAFHVWHVSGARSSGAPLTVSSAGRSYAVHVAFQTC